jgi:hypothetical protein
MISTRFDNPEYWVTAQGEVITIEDLETNHILNIIAMFERKPTLIQTLLIKDITSTRVWTPIKNDYKLSMNNITSMSIQELKDYWYSSELYQAMRNELLNRGVNVDQMMINFKEEK